MKKYHQRHKEERCVIFGTGPSLNSFNSSSFEDCIFLGSNEIIYHPLTMDYYFIGDGGNESRGYYSDPEAYIKYKASLQKFCRQPPLPRRSTYRTLPLGLDSFEYFTPTREAWDSASPFGVKEINDVGTISLEIFQFALLCGFTTIYLVGQDCNYAQGSFFSKVDKSTQDWGKMMSSMWVKCKHFIDSHYPNVDVISVKPVGLKGLFTDAS